jgi:hypothetical protein
MERLLLRRHPCRVLPPTLPGRVSEETTKVLRAVRQAVTEVAASPETRTPCVRWRVSRSRATPGCAGSASPKPHPTPWSDARDASTHVRHVMHDAGWSERWSSGGSISCEEESQHSMLREGTLYDPGVSLNASYQAARREEQQQPVRSAPRQR